jgi:hypothetical protein
MVGSCVHGNEPFGSVKRIKISSVDEHFWFLKKNFVPPRLLASYLLSEVVP